MTRTLTTRERRDNRRTAAESLPAVYDTTPTSTVTAYLSVVAGLASDEDGDLNRLFRQRFLTTATGQALGRYGDPFGVQRRTAESDESFRTRISGARRASASTTTYEDIAAIAVDVLGTDNIQIDAAEDVGAGNVRITVPADAVTNSPLTRQQLEGIIGDAVPPTHTVDLVDDDTFVLGATDDQGLGNGTLT